MKQLPKEYESRMKQLLGKDFESYLNELQNPPVKAFRVNTDKISLEDFEKINPFGSEKISYIENGFYLDFEKVGNHPFHHAGHLHRRVPSPPFQYSHQAHRSHLSLL